MRAKLKVFVAHDTRPVVTGLLNGDPIELLDIVQELNARWPGRRAEIEVYKPAPGDPAE